MSTEESGGGSTEYPGPVPTTSRRAVILSGSAVVAALSGFASMRAWEEDPGAAGAGSPSYDLGTGSGTAVALADLPAGGGVVLVAARAVVTRDETGEVHAFSAVCTHQGCLVSGVSAGTISCACHGSAFDAATGDVVEGPATAPLSAVPVTVQGDTVVVG